MRPDKSYLRCYRPTYRNVDLWSVRVICGLILTENANLRRDKVICGYILVYYSDLRSSKPESMLICGDLWWSAVICGFQADRRETLHIPLDSSGFLGRLWRLPAGGVKVSDMLWRLWVVLTPADATSTIEKSSSEPLNSSPLSTESFTSPSNSEGPFCELDFDSTGLRRLPAKNGESALAPNDCRLPFPVDNGSLLADAVPRVRTEVTASFLSPFTMPLLSTVRLRKFFWCRVTFLVTVVAKSSSSEPDEWCDVGATLRRGGDFFARPGDCLPGDLPGDGGASDARWRATRW